jgi:N-acetylglutamate synthase-like GNAT family acetyltransferase
LIASNAQGEAIGQLVRDAGFEVEDVEWSDIAPYWLVAVQDGEVVGCIQVAPAKPFGRLEMLAVSAELTDYLKSKAARMLLISGTSTLRAGGSQFATAMVAFKNKRMNRLLKKRGCTRMSQGNIMAWRL